MFVVTSANLSHVPGVIKETAQVEPAVTARLDNIERMMQTFSKSLNDIKSMPQGQWPALQVNGVPLQHPGGPQPPPDQVNAGNRSRTLVRNLSVGGPGLRSKSDSLKRKVGTE